MATTFYLVNEAAPYTPPSWQGGWDLDGSTSIHFDPHKFGAGSTTATRAETSATNPYKMGVLRCVSRRLAGQTISGTVDMVVGVSESNAAANFFTRLHLYVVDTADGSVVGTLLNGYTESSGGGATEWSTTNTGRALQGAQTLTGVTVPSDGGDYRLVAEIGVSAENADTTSRSATIRYGARNFSTGVAFGDLTVGSTSTTTLAGHFLFSGTVSLAADVIANLTPETATDIGTLPHSSSQTVRDGGHTYTPWYKFTPTTDVGMSWFGYGDASVYKPSITVFQGTDPSSLSSTSVDTSTGNLAAQIAFITPGQTYYVRHLRNSVSADPAVITLDVEAAPNGSASGHILINDDTLNVAMVASSRTGAIVKMVPGLAPGEAGDVLPSGVMAFEDINDGDVKLYDRNFTQIATVAINTSTLAGSIRANASTGKFWMGADVGANTEVKRVASDGTVEQTYTLTGIGNFKALAVSADEAVLYFSRGSGGIIGRWDLVNNVALSNLVADATIESIPDIIVLDDSTIVAAFITEGPPTNIVQARRYAADGTLLNTYDFGTDELFPLGTVPRLTRNPNSDASFWFFRHPSGADAGLSRFVNVDVETGASNVTLDAPEYELGIYNRPESATPEARFGVSFSCPIVVLPGARNEPVFDGSDPCCEDVSTLGEGGSGCIGGPALGAGSTGSMDAPANGTWSNTLNATSGSGGASGSSWSLPDEPLSESWL